ncbi:uncharacterized protein KD926_010288 [Aspergillus affinis]|uniref:uncharacterized protein n=1 Tax=Aspergillus affinis TaxID=1070780 RepID=UPI0022FE5B41|nr:uncharacterized protein KD926_010288 [Aspergillus affinis]KAI9044965.1 hypothetical protein KD926_010288 [Aspergillus affinis]
MSDPYLQQPPYPGAPAPAAPGGGNAAYYAPPDSVYQNPPYDYDPHQQPYAQQEGPPYDYNNHHQYGSQYDLSQNSAVPRSYPPPVLPPPPMPQPTEYLSPVSAEYPPPPGSLHRTGSNADYYDQHPSDPNLTNQEHNGNNKPEDADRSAAPDGADESERNLSGALLGGATGYYLGHKKSHGFLGAVGGALLGNYLGDKMSESGGGEGDDDDARSSQHSDVAMDIIITTITIIMMDTMDISDIGVGRDIVVIVMGGVMRGKGCWDRVGLTVTRVDTNLNDGGRVMMTTL